MIKFDAGNSKIRCCICKSENAKTLYKLKGYEVAECADCGMRYSWPPEKHDYEEKYFTKEQKQYFDEVNNSKKKIFESWLDAIEKYKKKGKILDIGCATGEFLGIAKKRKWQCYGFDISKYATDYARKKFKINARTGEFIKTYKPELFDAVFMSFIIEHTDNPAEIIKEIKRILKKKGLLFISTINEDSLLNLVADLIYKLSFGLIKKPIELLHARQHLAHFSEKDLVNLLEQNEFKMLQKEKIDLPSENFRGGILKDAVLKVFYFLQKVLGKEYIVWMIAKKD